MTREEIEQEKRVARLSVLSLISEMIIESTPQTAWDNLKRLAELLKQAIDHEVILLGTSEYDMFPPRGHDPSIK